MGFSKRCVVLCCVVISGIIFVFLDSTSPLMKKMIDKSGVKKRNSSSLVISAKSWRTANKKDAGPFLGMGDIPKSFMHMSISSSQRKFHRDMVHISYTCNNSPRIGRKGDGGYYVCTQGNFRPPENKCLVYSFGINNEWSFDEQMERQFGCEVHSFDPSMKKDDHEHKRGVYFHNLGVWGYNYVNEKGWMLKDLATIIKDLNHTDRIIDYLKLDVEGAEWSLMEHIVGSPVHSQIRQMAIEIHTPRILPHNMSLADYGEAYMSFQKLKDVGFMKYLYQTNNGCCGKFSELVNRRFYTKTVCCYELFFVNKRFL